MSKTAQNGKISDKAPAVNPRHSPMFLGKPKYEICFWLNPIVPLIIGDMLPNKYPTPAPDCTHIEATNTSHLLLKNALNPYVFVNISDTIIY